MSPVPAPSALEPRTIDEVVEAVRSQPRVFPVGAGTKAVPAAVPPGFIPLSLRALAGIREYDPAEYTFTALAGTPVQAVAEELARHGQYLPFDPPFAGAGATLGGTIATGLSGPGRQRYGGVRDFILGLRFVTGAGELVQGGGKVVKNAAGFDLPKLFVGSLGRLGVMAEVTFKVFPRPRAFATLRVELPGLEAALAASARLGASPFDLEGLEIDPPGTLWLRLGGAAETFAGRLDELERSVGGAGSRLEEEAEAEFWRRRVPLAADSATHLLVKVPVTLTAIPVLDALLAAAGAARHYGAGGSVAWMAWPGSAEELDTLLVTHGLSGLVLAGPSPRALLGRLRGEGFRRRIKAALDPDHRFPDF
jgi:glycolate oxidase FAD binding subunit